MDLDGPRLETGFLFWTGNNARFRMLRTTKKSLGFFSHDQKSPCWQRVFGVLCAADPLVQNCEPESNLVAMTEVFAVFCRVGVMVHREKGWILSNLEVQPMGAMTLLMRLETLQKSV